MGLLSWASGLVRRGRARIPREQLAAQSSAPAAAATPPSTGDMLTQLAGESKLSGDVRELLGTFNPRYVDVRTRLLMRLDPQVAFALAIRRAPIVNLRWTVEGNDPIIRAFVEQQLTKHYARLAKSATLSIPFGFQVIEPVWQAEDTEVKGGDRVKGEMETRRLPNAWTYRRFKGIDPQTLTLLVDQAADDYGGVEQRKPGSMQPTRVGPEKALLWSYRKEDVWGRLTGFPAFDATYEPWWFKVAIRLAANRYFERKAEPTTKVRGQNELRAGAEIRNGFDWMAQQLLQLRNGGYIMLPNTRDTQTQQYLFDLEYMLDDKRGDMIQAYIDGLDVDIMRSLWITDEAATSQEMGSRSRSEVHAELLGELGEEDVNEFLDELVNPQVVDPCVLHNFGERALRESGTRVVGKGLSQSMRDIMKEVLLQLFTAEQLLANGRKVSLAQRLDGASIADQLGLPLIPVDELEQLTEMQPDEPEPDPQAGEVDDQAVADELVGAGVTEDDDAE